MVTRKSRPKIKISVAEIKCSRLERMIFFRVRFMLIPAMDQAKPPATSKTGIRLSKGLRYEAVIPIIRVLIPAAMPMMTNFT